MDKQLRLDKFLADMGIGTRSEVKQYIRKGRIKINDQICKTPEYKLSPQTDAVFLDDRRIEYNKFIYIMLNKPRCVVSASNDGRSQTVIDLLGEKGRKDLFPVGRLDKDTEGLLLITNDGDLAHRLLSPKKLVDKIYYVRVAGRLTDEDKTAFREGIDIGDDKPTLPADLSVLASGEISEAQVCIREGRYHQIKRMFEALGKKVIYLKRLSMGPLILDEDLPCGSFRELTEQEISLLKNYKTEEL
ncbi:MAG: rRNA pseudouridine synthase [Clostridiales bacterium]|nr:rRNA pseudouridine synthase [Clostridiales bacterium]